MAKGDNEERGARKCETCLFFTVESHSDPDHRTGYCGQVKQLGYLIRHSFDWCYDWAPDMSKL